MGKIHTIVEFSREWAGWGEGERVHKGTRKEKSKDYKVNKNKCHDGIREERVKLYIKKYEQ